MRTPIALTLSAMLAVVTLYVWQWPAPASEPNAAELPVLENEQLQPPHPTAETAAAPIATRTPTKQDADHSRELLLPDGTYVPALNDAVGAAAIAEYWGPGAWSPIIGVRTNTAGLDWYEHADGSFSTTQMVMRADLGRLAAMTRVAHPRSETVPNTGPNSQRR